MKLNDSQAVILGGYGVNSKNTLFINLVNFDMTPGPKMNNEWYAFACTVFDSQAHEGRSIIIVAGSQIGIGKTTEILDYTIENPVWEESE